MQQHPPIQIVDANDQPIGEAKMDDAHQKSQWHRIVRIMVQAPDGSFLLQKRSMRMNTSPGFWDNSAAGHVDAGEDYATAAKRELAEEAGITGVELQEVNYYKTEVNYKNYVLRRFQKVYLVNVEKNVKLKKQDEEVSELRWFSKAELDNLIKNSSDKVTSGLIDALDYLRANKRSK